MFGWLTLVVTATAAVTGYIVARNFVRGRLRFVDAAYSRAAPFLAGILTAMVAWPLAILPIITTTTAALLGVGVGFGTASGVRALKRGT